MLTENISNTTNCNYTDTDTKTTNLINETYLNENSETTATIFEDSTKSYKINEENPDILKDIQPTHAVHFYTPKVYNTSEKNRTWTKIVELITNNYSDKDTTLDFTSDTNFSHLVLIGNVPVLSHNLLSNYSLSYLVNMFTQEQKTMKPSQTSLIHSGIKKQEYETQKNILDYTIDNDERNFTSVTYKFESLEFQDYGVNNNISYDPKNATQNIKLPEYTKLPEANETIKIVPNLPKYNVSGSTSSVENILKVNISEEYVNTIYSETVYDYQTMEDLLRSTIYTTLYKKEISEEIRTALYTTGNFLLW
jgi:hypothetical protein